MNIPPVPQGEVRLLTCIDAPAAPPKLEPRRMPALRVACPAPREGGAQRYRMPLWRLFEGLGD